MRRIFAAFLALIIIATSVAAQPFPAAQSSKIAKLIKINTIGFLGKGVAISPEDPMNFMLAKAGIGTLKVFWAGEETEITIGILILDDTKYKLKDITIEEGSAYGNIYRNNTQIGTFNVSSVSKGNIDVWAGTVTLEGETYYIYIVEAERPFKPAEIKERVKLAVGKICASPSKRVASLCRQGNLKNYCLTHPEDERCKEIFQEYCIKENKLRDVRCRIFVKKYCEAHPEIENCALYSIKKTARFCERHPHSRICRSLEASIISYCLKNPNTERCRKYCAKYPERCKFIVKNLADFCVEHPKHPNCLEYCKEHPKACQKLLKNLADFCIKHPDHPDCKEYCKAHPVACKVVSAELARFCIGNAEHPRCVKYCKEHPGACKEIVADASVYCARHPNAEECEVFCKKYPEKCAAPVSQEEKPIPITIKSVKSVISKVSGGGIAEAVK